MMFRLLEILAAFHTRGCSDGECQCQNATNWCHTDGITRQLTDELVQELIGCRLQAEALNSHEAVKLLSENAP